MDPLSVIASVIAISEAFGMGVKTLKSLANTSSEFSDMLVELSALQAWLDQLRMATESLTSTATTTEFQIPGDLLGRLELTKVELSQIVNAMGDIQRKMTRVTEVTEEKPEAKTKMFNRKGEQSVSVIHWQRSRGKIERLRDRARRCREELSSCLDLVNLSQQLQQHQTTREILTISHTQYSLMQTTMTRFEERFDALESLLSQDNDQHRRGRPVGFIVESPSSTSLDTTNTTDSTPDDDDRAAVEAYRGQRTTTKTETKTTTMTTMTTEEKYSVTEIQVPIRQKKNLCSRYCRCQCHKNSAVRFPSWSQALIGSMMLQYNGTVRLDTNPCDLPSCQSGKGREVRVAYSFPSWLTSRAVHLSASWGSLTDVGASLHLTVPRVCEPFGIWQALEYDDAKWLQSMVERRVLLPTDISSAGEPYLLGAAREDSRKSVKVLMRMGFKPYFQDSTTGLSAAVYVRRRSLLDNWDPLKQQPKWADWNHPLLEQATKTDADADADGTDREVSTMIRDAILLQSPTVTLEDALAAEVGSNGQEIINDLDDLGLAPLHWAAARGTPEQIDLLLQYGADLELMEPYSGNTPLRFAVRKGNAPCVAFLLSRGANMRAMGLNSCGVLHICKSIEAMRVLLDHNLNSPDLKQLLNEAECPASQTALHHVILSASISSRGVVNPRASVLVDMLASAGADVDAADGDGDTPLLTAIKRPIVQAVKVLHGHGARFDCVNDVGRGVLHFTAIHTDAAMMDTLRSLNIEGVDPDRPDNKGWTAIEHFRARMERPWVPGQKRPTQRDVFAFYALVTEIRRRNWDEKGLFLDRREQLEGMGYLRGTRAWLGWHWQLLYDYPDYGDVIWDAKRDLYPETFFYYEEDEDDVDYSNIGGLLFGESDGVHDGAPDLAEEEEEEVEGEEFFDAME